MKCRDFVTVQNYTESIGSSTKKYSVQRKSTNATERNQAGYRACSAVDTVSGPGITANAWLRCMTSLKVVSRRLPLQMPSRIHYRYRAARIVSRNSQNQAAPRSGAGLNELSGMIGRATLSGSPGNPLISASSARTRPSPGIHACTRRSVRVPRLVWLEPLSRTRRRDWLRASGAW